MGPPQDPAAEIADRQRQTQGELDAIARDIRVSEERAAEIRQEIEGLERDRVRITEQLVATSTRIQDLETRLTASEARIAGVETEAAAVRRSLAARRAVTADVLAALQRIGRKPPPALLVRPEDALASVRSAILVGALLPELRLEAERLVADLERLIRLRDRSAAERDRFRADLGSIAEERNRLEQLLEERKRVKTDQQRRLDEERRRAAEMAGRAGSLKDLITRLETEIEGARKAAEAARKADEVAKLRPDGSQKSVTPALRDPSRMQPAVPFAEARGLLPLPVAGQQIKAFGEDDGLGGTMRGIQIAARAEARVASPCDGWIVYAGPFRSYGKVLIINGGGGYHVVLAGLDRIDVEMGQFVLAGEPVGAMGARRVASAAIGVSAPGSGLTELSATLPVLYVEFRKENSSIDPTPWWAQSRDEKVRG
ncbi:murein hydrolase activator EnvC family protein [Prosthecomicrobium sp. N25]|uniref:murein hydrolase activator EnvC family protein n=1 Tax=Prosthecomicrobium sp. N25 TaxID=3129254 RepID=UPI003077EC61